MGRARAGGGPEVELLQAVRHRGDTAQLQLLGPRQLVACDAEGTGPINIALQEKETPQASS